MNAYLTAWQRYTAAEREVSWAAAMEYHLQHPRAAVVSLPEAFVMARLVRRVEAATHAELEDLAGLEGCSRLEWQQGLDCWHVWAAAGRLEAIGGILAGYQGPARVRWVSFQRRADPSVRVFRIARVFPQLAHHPTPAHPDEDTETTRTGHALPRGDGERERPDGR